MNGPLHLRDLATDDPDPQDLTLIPLKLLIAHHVFSEVVGRVMQEAEWTPETRATLERAFSRLSQVQSSVQRVAVLRMIAICAEGGSSCH